MIEHVPDVPAARLPTISDEKENFARQKFEAAKKRIREKVSRDLLPCQVDHRPEAEHIRHCKFTALRFTSKVI